MAASEETAIGNQQSASSLAGAALPAELKDAGWKIERRVKNDDQENPLFLVSNQKLQLATTPVKTLDEAIEGALILQTRSEGKKVSRVKIKKRVKQLAKDGGQQPGEEETATAAPRQMLAIKKIRRDGGTQPREGLDLATVARYAEDKKAGAKFKPSIVFYDGKNHWLGRGFHRTAADERNGQARTECEIRQGTQRDAVLFSLGENASHGLPRTNEQKRNAVLTMLRDPEWSVMSNGWIAEKTRTSEPFVSKLRRELNGPTPNVSSSPAGGALSHGRASAPAAPAPRVTKGRDGKVRNTANIGAKKKATGQASISAPDEQLKVTDKRRFADPPADAGRVSELPAPQKQVAIEDLLKGRMLTLSFAWIPKVPGVNVTVNASTDREKAVRKLIGSVEVPRMPEAVIEMIAAALGEKGPTSKVQSPKSKSTPARPTKKNGKRLGWKASQNAQEKAAAAKKKPAKKR